MSTSDNECCKIQYLKKTELLLTPVEYLRGIHGESENDGFHETKRKIAADNVLSLSKNTANLSLVIKIDVT